MGFHGVFDGKKKMSKTIQKKMKFSKGMVSSDLAERQDMALLDESAAEMENYTATIYGGFRTRRGTRFVGNDIGKQSGGGGTVISVLGDKAHVFDDEPFVSDKIGTNRNIVDISFENEAGVRLVIGNIGSVVKEDEKRIVEGRTGRGTVRANGVYEISVVGAGGGSAGRGSN